MTTEQVPERTESIKDAEISLIKRLLDQLRERHEDDKRLIKQLQQALLRDEVICDKCSKVKTPPDPCLCDLEDLDL